jgi:transcription elongation GreA/GreB family factor
VTCPRFLTQEETGLIEEDAVHWLRLGDVEVNAGEYALALLALSQLREPRCARQDIATLDRTILLQVPGEQEPVPLTLVRPRDEDLWRGRVSVLSDLGLACIGQVLGSEVRIQRSLAKLVGFVDRRAPDPDRSVEKSDARA